MEKDSLLLLLSISIFLFSIFGIIGTYSSIVEFSNLITGHYIEVGVINLSVTDVASLNFTNGVINFGPGYVQAGASFAVIDTLGGVIDGGWNSTTTRFEITNLGNVNLTINVSSGKTAAIFIGGNNPSYKYNVSEGNSGVCDPPAGFSLGTFYEVNTTLDSREICNTFLPGENISIDLQLTIPSDSDVGILKDSISIIYEETS